MFKKYLNVKCLSFRENTNFNTMSSVEWSEDYMNWKVETLALQKSHKESQQRTGLWGADRQFAASYGAGGRPRDNNEYIIELTPGWR